MSLTLISERGLFSNYLFLFRVVVSELSTGSKCNEIARPSLAPLVCGLAISTLERSLSSMSSPNHFSAFGAHMRHTTLGRSLEEK